MIPLGSPTYRATPTSPRAYWRQNMAHLNAATPSFTVPASGTVFRSIGPQGMGERWIVRDVQVQTSSQYKQPPLVIQQVQAQQAGSTVTPPPPIVAEVWRAVATQREILLATTNKGGYDSMGVSVQLTAGEQIMVIWYGANPGDTVQAIIKGTKIVLGV
jgi:hypothetical protein